MDFSLSNSLVSTAVSNPDKLSLNLQFATDKTLTARKGPTPVFTRASSGTFVNTNGIIVGKTAGTTGSITPSTTTIGSQVTVTVASGSVVGWVVGQAISLIVDTDADDQADANELWLLGDIVSTTPTTLTFTVTSRTAQAGSITSWTLGYRGARFDHDPITLACKGLLIEESRTNLYSRSQEFEDNTVWTKTRSSITVNATTAPDGTLTADKLVEDTTSSNTHTIGIAVTPSATAHTLSLFAKKGERTWIVLRLGAVNTFFNLDDGTIASGSINTPTITNFGNGWYRCTVTSSAGTQGSVLIAANSTTTSYTGDGTSGFFLWGAQLEAGSFPTSYIPTTSASVVRSADVCSITGIAFAGMYNQSEGTINVSTTALAGTNSTIGCLAIVASDRSVCAVNLNFDGNFNRAESIVTQGPSFAEAAKFTKSPITSKSYKVALAYKQNDFACSYDGESAATDTLGNYPTATLISMLIGTNGGQRYFGHIASIRYFKKRLANAKLQSITV